MIATIIEKITPYTAYIKIGLSLLVVILLIWFGWNEKGIRAELEKQKADALFQKNTAELYAKQFNAYIKLNKDIADAIKTIKVLSNTYISNIEASKPPAVNDGDSFVLISSGVPNVSTNTYMPKYKNYSTNRIPSEPP